MKCCVLLAALAVCAGSASATVRINEVFINPPGTDNGFEFLELKGAANESLNNLWLICIEGDSSGTQAGTVDQAISLTGFSCGTNGLFLQRDAATVLSPAPDAGTTVRIADFNPDFENGSTSYLLVSGFTGAVGNDLDTNNDGVIDVALPWTSVLSSVALLENDGPTTNFGYAAQFGGVNFGPQAGFNADAFVYGTDGLYYGMDMSLTTTNPGPYAFDTTRMADQTGALVTVAGNLTPGSENVIPTPGALALLSIGSLLTFRRRR